jgi:hypothetical protein
MHYLRRCLRVTGMKCTGAQFRHRVVDVIDPQAELLQPVIGIRRR